MDTIISAAQGAIKTILDMPAILLFAFALNVVGWILKKIPAVPNNAIPLAIIGIAGLVTPFILAPAPGQMDPNLANPAAADWIRRISIGLILGLLAWGAHALIFTQLAKVLPGLKEDNETTKPQ